MGQMTLGHSPCDFQKLNSTVCWVTGSMAVCVYQIIEDHFPCEDASTEPHIPPTNPWLELDGSPTYQVIRFQTIAPVSAHSSAASVM